MQDDGRHRQNEMKVSMSEVAPTTLVVRPAWEVEGIAMCYPPCWEIEPGIHRHL